MCYERRILMKRFAYVVVTVVGAAIVSACAAPSQDAFGIIGDRQANNSYEITGTLPELLANADELGITVVEGTVDTVEPGAGMTWTLDDNGENEQRQILPFDDDAAMVRSVHVTMSAERVLVGSSDGATVRFGLAISDDSDAAKLRDGLSGNEYVAVLTASPVFDYEPGLHGVLFDGGLLCIWDDERNLDCPALDEGMRSALAVAEVSEADLTAG